MRLLASVVALEMGPVGKDTHGAHEFSVMNPNRTPQIFDKAKELAGKARFLACFVVNIAV